MRNLLTLFIVLVGAHAMAQQELPKYMTDAEKSQMADYVDFVRSNAAARQATDPENPRTPGEWEELQGLAIAWSNTFASIQADIVKHAREEVTVYIVTTNETAVKNYLDNRNVDYSSNVTFVNGNYNSLWIRDYGPNSVYINDVDSLIFVDWIYNRPRFLDDQVPQLIGNHMDVSVVELANQPDDLVHTGGNFMTNGHGQGFSSNLVLDENGPDNDWGMSNHDEAAVNDLMNRFMGIDEYVKMTNLPFDAIHHIDMHMKLINEETLIMGEYPTGTADGPQIEANLQYVLDQFRTNYDRPFRVIRMPMPPDANGRYPDNNGDYRTYTNAIMINKTVLVPTYEQQYDDVALDIWEETLPGHNIVGINCNAIIPLSGALHCITKEIAAHDPIWISHKSFNNSSSIFVDDTITFVAQVKHKFPISQVDVMYTTQMDGSQDSIPMVYDNVNDVWAADLIIDYFDQYEYYIRVRSENGKEIEKPLTGSLGGGYRFYTYVTSTNDVNSSYAFDVGAAFPNPAIAMTAIPLELNAPRHVRASLIDQLGRQVVSIYNDDYPTHKTHLFFDASNIPEGAYTIVIEIEGEVASQNIIIQ